MKTSRFSDTQSIAILKQAEAGAPFQELCREPSISRTTFYKWRSKFGGGGRLAHGAPKGRDHHRVHGKIVVMLSARREMETKAVAHYAISVWLARC